MTEHDRIALMAAILASGRPNYYVVEVVDAALAINDLLGRELAARYESRPLSESIDTRTSLDL